MLKREDLSDAKIDYLAIKSAKRGNDVYEYRIKQRLKPIEIMAEELDGDIFEDDDMTILNDKTSKAWTNALFVTLTYDINRSDSPTAWRDLGSDLNLFLANIRKQFGKISYIRAFEAFGNGYPHIHLLIIFKETRFKVFKYHDVYRIEDKHIFEQWYHSFVDIRAVRNLKHAIRYIVKYLKKLNGNLKEAKPENYYKALLTQGLQWLYNKRAYAVSGDFLRVLKQEHARLESMKHNSNLLKLSDGTRGKVVGYDLLGQPILKKFKFTFLGSYAWNNLVICGNWAKEDGAPWLMVGVDPQKLPEQDKSRLRAFDPDFEPEPTNEGMARLYAHSDVWICTRCRKKGDKWAILAHKCEARDMQASEVDPHGLDGYH